MIIGLCGEKNSGKDTVAAYLNKEYDFERRAFADPLKKSVAALLDIPFHKIDEYKNNEDISVTVVNEVGQLRIVSFTFRQFLQRYGTESHRDVFGEGFWLDHTLPADAYYAGRKIAITDLRFSNEADRIKELGGHIVRIYRSGASDSKDHHRSEQINFPVDHIIYNNGTLDELWPKIESMLMVFE